MKNNIITPYYWEVITNSDIVISELNSTTKIYKTLPIDELKQFYLTNGTTKVGITNSMLTNRIEFFINNKVLDLHLSQIIYKVFQYKTVTKSLITNQDELFYNIGIFTEDNHYNYKYTISIKHPNIDLIAEKYDKDKLIDTKQITLQR